MTTLRRSLRTAVALLLASSSITSAGADPRAAAPEADAATTVLVVRHAERQGDADALSSLGEARAETLAHTLAAAGVDAVYHSAAERTRATARPLAERLGLTPVEHPPLAVAPLAARLRAEHPGEVVLVVGHSNTVPAIVHALGGPQMPDLAHDAYDDLFLVTIGAGGETTVLHLQFGAETP